MFTLGTWLDLIHDWSIYIHVVISFLIELIILSLIFKVIIHSHLIYQN